MKLFLQKSWPFIVLAILTFSVHFAFLSYPSQVVFDEVHFGKFVSAYFTGQYYFDIHPPLGKLLIAGWAKLNGFNQVFDFDHIGEQAAPQLFFTLRFLPALFGVFFVLAFSWLAYLATRSKKTALIAGFLILLDNAFLVQSHFILVDIFMLFFEVLALCFFFLYQRQKSFSNKWFLYLVLAAVSFGLTVSIKWTGVATIGIVSVVLVVKIFSGKLAVYLSPPKPEDSLAPFSRKKWMLTKEALISLIILIIIGFFVYAIPFVIHFNLLTKSGPGDAFMSPAWQQELKYGRENVTQPLTFWQKFSELNKTMYTASAGITASHPYGSRWYTWPIDHKPVYYWNQSPAQLSPGSNANIYFVGNPALWWTFVVSILFVLTSLLGKKRNQIQVIYYVLILGYLANLLPFILIKRVSFLYHYLPSAMYGIMLLAILLGTIWLKEKKLFAIIFIIVAAGFVLLIPLSYGLIMPQSLSNLPLQTVYFLTQ